MYHKPKAIKKITLVPTAQYEISGNYKAWNPQEKTLCLGFCSHASKRSLSPNKNFFFEKDMACQLCDVEELHR